MDGWDDKWLRQYMSPDHQPTNQTYVIYQNIHFAHVSSNPTIIISYRYSILTWYQMSARLIETLSNRSYSSCRVPTSRSKEPPAPLWVTSPLTVRINQIYADRGRCLHIWVAENKVSIVQLGGLTPLIRQMLSANVEVQCNAVGCITNLATHEENKAKIARSGALGPLTKLAKSRDMRVQRNATGALLNMTHSGTC